MSTAPKTGPSPEVTSVAECVAWALAGATEGARRRIGIELERLVLGPDGRLLPYDGPVSIRTLLEGLAARHGWTPVLERGHLVGVTRDGASVSLEGGGQLEFSGAPHATVAAIGAEFADHRAELAAVGGPLGLRYVWVGHNPVEHLPGLPEVPRERAAVLRQIFPRRGTTGVASVLYSCATQVSLDFRDAADCVEMVRLGHLLSPVLIALFANTPVVRGAPAAMRSHRAGLYEDLDAARCGAPPLVFDRGTTLDDLIAWVWDVPMSFLAEGRADGTSRYVILDGTLTFRRYVAEGYHGRRATLADWELHVSTILTDVRWRRQLEFRQCDSVPPEAFAALPALVKGLCYDDAARRRCLALLEDGAGGVDRAALRAAACRNALDAVVGDWRLRDVARETLVIARAGLASQELAARVAGGAMDPEAAEALGLLEAIVAGERPPFWAALGARWAASPTLAGIADPA